MKKWWMAWCCVCACTREPDATACFGVCGEGTICQSGRCIVAPARVIEEEPAPKVRRMRTPRKRTRHANQAEEAQDNIPAYNEARARTLPDGTEQLTQRQVNATMARVEPRFQTCIDAAEQHQRLGAGSIHFSFSVSPTGNVTGVSVTIPPALAAPGLSACLRRAVYEQRFPAYDGPDTDVDYRFTVE